MLVAAPCDVMAVDAPKDVTAVVAMPGSGDAAVAPAFGQYRAAKKRPGKKRSGNIWYYSSMATDEHGLQFTIDRQATLSRGPGQIIYKESEPGEWTLVTIPDGGLPVTKGERFMITAPEHEGPIFTTHKTATLARVFIRTA